MCPAKSDKIDLAQRLRTHRDVLHGRAQGGSMANRAGIGQGRAQMLGPQQPLLHGGRNQATRRSWAFKAGGGNDQGRCQSLATGNRMTRHLVPLTGPMHHHVQLGHLTNSCRTRDEDVQLRSFPTNQSRRFGCGKGGEDGAGAAVDQARLVTDVDIEKASVQNNRPADKPPTSRVKLRPDRVPVVAQVSQLRP